MSDAEQILAFAIRELKAIGVDAQTPEQVMSWYRNNSSRYQLLKMCPSDGLFFVGKTRVSGETYNQQADLNSAINAAGMVRISDPDEEGYW